MTSTTSSRRLGAWLSATALAAALIVPAAAAADHSRSRNGATGPSFVTDTLAPGGTPAHAQSYHFVTDTLAPGGTPAQTQGYRFVTDTLAPGGTPAQTQGYRFVTDTLAPGGTPAQTPSYRFVTDTLAPGAVRSIQVVSSGNGFSWRDAGAGAGTAIAALLVLTSGVTLLRRRRVATS
jgi:hypothetical protein